MLGDPDDPLAIPGEPKNAQLIIEAYERGDLDLNELEERLDALLGTGKTLEQVYAKEQAEEQRIATEAQQRQDLQRLIETDIEHAEATGQAAKRYGSPTNPTDLTSNPKTFVDLCRKRLEAERQQEQSPSRPTA